VKLHQQFLVFTNYQRHSHVSILLPFSFFSALPSLPSSLPPFIHLPPSFLFIGAAPLEAMQLGRLESAVSSPSGFRYSPARQTVSMHSEVKNRPLSCMVIGYSGVEEVYRRRTSITSHNVDQNLGVVGHPT